ncbi:hypothetical protein BpHYR1_031310 [Brachionus plicatilis]|uniref:Uncharacterized protein n=1 Tax=Brachionus plicatilis TaxID=10195 RepID=A0A3M7T790_BRAPC|nr:hypothetical protein BpHYR1_031310 [Brachionus plicatilis]
MHRFSKKNKHNKVKNNKYAQGFKYFSGFANIYKYTLTKISVLIKIFRKIIQRIVFLSCLWSLKQFFYIITNRFHLKRYFTVNWCINLIYYQ